MDHCQQMCFMKFFFLWFVVILRTTDGGSVTWFEPPPVEVITDSTANPIVNRNLTKGFEEKLSWNFSLTVDLSLITVTLAFQASSPGSSFENVATYVQTVGTANVEPGFEDQFNVSWIPSKITLTIFNATTKNNGEFECRLLLFDGRITITWRRKIQVTVLVPPNITSITESQTVNEGETLTLSCAADGITPKPNITWTRLSDNRVVINNIWTLNNISRQENGTYRCTADNGVGSPAVKDVIITVHYAPESVNLSKNIASDEICAGNMVQFTCKAGAANPEVERYTLNRNNTVIANMSSSGVSTLWLNTSGHFIYKCEADNSVGTGTSNRISVTVEEDEPTSTTPAQSEEKIHSGELPLEKINGKEAVYREEYKDLNNPVTKGVTGPFKEKMDETYLNEATTEVTKLRNGSVIVSFNLIFTNPVTTNEAFAKLRSVIVNGTFGPFEVGALTVVSTPTTTPTKQASDEPCEESFFKKEDCSVKLEVAVGISVAAVVLIVIIVAVVGYCIHKERKCRKDTRIADHPECEEQRLQGDDPHAQVNNGYAETGPPSANSTEKAAAAVPDYAVVDKSAKKKKKKQDEEKPPEYAVVDKSKKKKKNEKVDDTYAKVDMSKKTSKKKPRPGEDVLYADLGDFNGTSQMPAVATSPKALPPIKKPDPYEGTQYADITQFLKGDAILPKNEKQDDKQATKMKEKDEKADGAGGENAPLETPM